MAVITDYDSLVDNIVDTTEDDSLEMADYIPTAIDLAEERLIRENDFPQLERDATGSIIAGNSSITEPADYDYITFFQLTNAAGQRFLMKRRTEDFLVDYWPDTSVQDVPKYYSISGFTGQVLIVPTSDANYDYVIKHMKSPNKLSISNQTNYFTNKCQDMLFYACMVEIVRFQKAWSQVQVWETAYQNARQSWNLQAARQRRDDGTTPKNPEGGQNTVTHNLQSGSTS